MYCRVKLLTDGVQDYLTKPFLAEELLARVGRLIADRQRSEAAIQEAYTLLRAATEGLNSVAVFVKDLGGRYLLINSAGERYFGRSAADILGHDDHAFCTPDMADQIRHTDEQIMAEGWPTPVKKLSPPQVKCGPISPPKGRTTTSTARSSG